MEWPGCGNGHWKMTLVMRCSKSRGYSDGAGSREAFWVPICSGRAKVVIEKRASGVSGMSKVQPRD